MSIGFKTCPYCNKGEAEAVYAIDNKIEWFCIECLAEWSEDANEYEIITAQQEWMMRYYGEE